MKVKRILLTLFLLFSTSFVFSQELTAKKMSEQAVAKENPEDAVKYIQSVIEKITVPAEKKSAYAFLGTLQESMALYADAQKSYSIAAGITAGNAEGMPKKSSERLVIDAVRCALSAGDYETAKNWLNSAVRNSKSEEIQATVKLYDQWCALSSAETYEQTIEPVAMLKAYLEIPSMQIQKPAVLLTLWYITGEKTYSQMLEKEFPQSPETAIATGNAQIYPAPFWYFVPRKIK